MYEKMALDMLARGEMSVLIGPSGRSILARGEAVPKSAVLAQFFGRTNFISGTLGPGIPSLPALTVNSAVGVFGADNFVDREFGPLQTPSVRDGTPVGGAFDSMPYLNQTGQTSVGTALPPVPLLGLNRVTNSHYQIGAFAITAISRGPALRALDDQGRPPPAGLLYQDGRLSSRLGAGFIQCLGHTGQFITVAFPLPGERETVIIIPADDNGYAPAIWRGPQLQAAVGLDGLATSYLRSRFTYTIPAIEAVYGDAALYSVQVTAIPLDAIANEAVEFSLRPPFTGAPPLPDIVEGSGRSSICLDHDSHSEIILGDEPAVAHELAHAALRVKGQPDPDHGRDFQRMFLLARSTRGTVSERWIALWALLAPNAYRL